MTNSPEERPSAAPLRTDGPLTPAHSDSAPDLAEESPVEVVVEVVPVNAEATGAAASGTTDAAADAATGVVDTASDATPGAVSEVPGVSDAAIDAAPDGAIAGHDEALDAGTYDRLLEPRSPNRLELAEGVWHQVSPKYVLVQFIATGIWLALAAIVVIVFAFVLHQPWVWGPAAVVAVILVWFLVITPRQARSIGYQLRSDDLVFRRGILWQRMVAVPYGRMQLVDITHGPLDRGFGIAQLKFVTAAAATGVVIPGLPQETAESLRDHLVAVAESRRTGL